MLEVNRNSHHNKDTMLGHTNKVRKKLIMEREQQFARVPVYDQPVTIQFCLLVYIDNGNGVEKQAYRRNESTDDSSQSHTRYGEEGSCWYT